MGERIEWEEIERFRDWADLAIRLEETTRTGFPAKVPMYAGDALRLLAALEAGEAVAIRLRILLDLMELKSPGRVTLREYELKAIEAHDDWRRCVAPRD